MWSRPYLSLFSHLISSLLFSSRLVSSRVVSSLLVSSYLFLLSLTHIYPYNSGNKFGAIDEDGANERIRQRQKEAEDGIRAKERAIYMKERKAKRAVMKRIGEEENARMVEEEELQLSFGDTFWGIDKARRQ